MKGKKKKKRNRLQRKKRVSGDKRILLRKRTNVIALNANEEVANSLETF